MKNWKKLAWFLILPPMLISCANKQLKRSLQNSSLDGLRHESLSRYTDKDLQKIKGFAKNIALCHQGRYNEAFDLFKSSLDKNQKNPVYWNHLGTCYYLKGEYPKSLLYLEISMSLTKNKKILASVHNNVGLVHLKQKNLLESKRHLDKSVEMDSSSWTPKYNLAQLFLSGGLYDRAEELLKKLLAHNPRDVDFNYSMAHLLLMKKNFSKALGYFNRIPKKHLKRDDVALNLATTFYLMGKPGRALATLEEAPMQVAEFALQQGELKKQIERQMKK